jgi:hypothetical protein
MIASENLDTKTQPTYADCVSEKVCLVLTLFPVPTFGAHLAAAAGFPTPFSVTSGVFGLVAGPSNALRR